nr:hybrid sensor histidine kinase/response regulator [arsenite-oxidising bacterium NT-25]
MPDPVNILLVDDQPAKLLSYEVILQELGENLLVAQSAREALEHLLRTDVAVILVDVCMPEQDGFELVELIRAHPRFEKTPVIFVSAVMMTEPDRLRGYAAGAVDYVSVPIVPDVLRAKVRVFVELYRKTRELERLNADLERRVQERTAELETSYQQLQTLNEELENRIELRTREREEAMAQLFEAQKLDTIGQLTGGVAHDFNNLLMAALGSLSLLRKRIPAEEKNLRLLDNAVQAAERGAALTQRLLAFARRQELKPQAVDLVQLLGSIEGLLQRAVGPTIRLENRLPVELPPALVDANQLELAILNLAVNARDAIQQEGVISIDAEETIPGDHDLPPGLSAGRYLRVRVADTGSGMDEETLARAAEPFFTTKGLGKGTGLGLSMVHGLAAQSGGILQLHSTPGEGTTAELWLPVAKDDVSEHAGAAQSAWSASGEAEAAASLRILVVDDDVLVCMGTVDMLEDLGHRVTEANSGQAALEIVNSGQSFDLVITDHAMPGMSGADLARSLLSANPAQPIILASGYAELPDGASVGALSRLVKPFTQEQLAQAISMAISRDATAASHAPLQRNGTM